MKFLMTAALPQVVNRRVLSGAAAAMLGAVLAMPAQAYPVQSWNGYHWARTGPLDIRAGNNLTGTWATYLNTATTAWSAAPNIDYTVVGGTAGTACGAVFGTLQVCNANYGANGWLGYTNVWTSGGFVVQAVTRLNDYYFGTATYNTDAWRQATVCHELGHVLGLAHADTSRSNLNIGSCLDYTSNPGGKLGSVNGTISNTGPGANDFAALAVIYAKLDNTQLSSTKPGSTMMQSGDGYYVSALGAVPEASTWAMLIAGFGLVGGVSRRQRERSLAA